MTALSTDLLPYEYQLENKPNETITILQDPSGVLHGGIGATVWDCALALAKMLEKQAALSDSSLWPKISKSKRILELGAGTGILGLVMTSLLDHQSTTELVLTDQKCALELLRHNINDFQKRIASTQVTIRVQELDWTSSDSISSFKEPFDTILIADCVHWPELFSPLVNVLRQLTHTSSTIILGYERRDFSTEVDFFREFGEYFRFRSIPRELCHDDWFSEDLYLFQAWPRQKDGE